MDKYKNEIISRMIFFKKMYVTVMFKIINNKYLATYTIYKFNYNYLNLIQMQILISTLSKIVCVVLSSLLVKTAGS